MVLYHNYLLPSHNSNVASVDLATDIFKKEYRIRRQINFEFSKIILVRLLHSQYFSTVSAERENAVICFFGSLAARMTVITTGDSTVHSDACTLQRPASLLSSMHRFNLRLYRSTSRNKLKAAISTPQSFLRS